MSRRRRYNVEPIGKRLKPKRGWHRQDIGLGGHPPVHVRNGYTARPCEGEAHSNPFIDHCMSCAPMWGVVAVADYVDPSPRAREQLRAGLESAKAAIHAGQSFKHVAIDDTTSIATMRGLDGLGYDWEE